MQFTESITIRSREVLPRPSQCHEDCRQEHYGAGWRRDPECSPLKIPKSSAKSNTALRAAARRAGIDVERRIPIPDRNAPTTGMALREKTSFSASSSSFRQPAQAQCCLDALFCRMSERMANQPFPVARRPGQPAFANLEGQVRLILGDVAEVIGHTAPHIQVCIVRANARGARAPGVGRAEGSPAEKVLSGRRPEMKRDRNQLAPTRHCAPDSPRHHGQAVRPTNCPSGSSEARRECAARLRPGASLAVAWRTQDFQCPDGQKVRSLIFNHLRIQIRRLRRKKSSGNFREKPGRSSAARRGELPVRTRRTGSQRRRHWTQQTAPFSGFSAFGVAAALKFDRAVGAVEKPRRAAPARSLWCKGAFKALTTLFIVRPLSHTGWDNGGPRGSIPGRKEGSRPVVSGSVGKWVSG